MRLALTSITFTEMPLEPGGGNPKQDNRSGVDAHVGVAVTSFWGFGSKRTPTVADTAPKPHGLW